MGQPSYGVSWKYCFTFSPESTLCRWGEFVKQNYRCRPAIANGCHSEGPLRYRVRVRLGLAIGGPSLWWPLAMVALRYGSPKPNYIVTRTALQHNFWSAGKNPNLDPDLLNPKLLGLTECQWLLLCQVPSYSHQGFLFCANIHTHAHCDKMIVISLMTT